MHGSSSPVPSPPLPNSRVAHLRNLSPIITRNNLFELCSDFGHVSDILLLHGKQQALIEFATEAECVHFVKSFSGSAPHLQTEQILVQFSRHNTLTTQNSSFTFETPSAVLLVSIINPLYQITLDSLNSVFGPFEPTLGGSVLKIVMFSKSGRLQALIQFSSASAAIEAKRALNGKNVYAQSCTLHIQFSSVTELHITENSDKAHDFTEPRPTRVRSSSKAVLPSMMNFGGWMTHEPGHLVGGDEKVVLIVSDFDKERVNPSGLFNLFSNFGRVVKVKLLHNKPDTALVQFVSAEEAASAQKALHSTPIFGLLLDVNFSNIQNIVLSGRGIEDDSIKHELDNTDLSLTRSFWTSTTFSTHLAHPSEYLHLSNFPPTTTAEEISVFLASVAEAKRVSIQTRGGRGMAIAEFASLEQANNVMVTLHRMVFNGRPLVVSYTRSKL
ncbi:putative Polypyrimidine tract-binding protein [Blattamonas nauphoetae]|uniref:Polypyrimidine tract-binding protein n=1 Tax=Blattamonas nauphoetae TaxID=2049346 RepID=A0ABQ9XU68_9EUKA|nr:putative Polypyrimidine tract-binding protein [Blattamonas nauphoetae]